MSAASSQPRLPDAPPPLEVLAKVVLTITSSVGDARLAAMKLTAGEDPAIAAVHFAEQNGLGNAAHIMALAERLHAAAESEGTLDRVKELANATTWLKTAGAHKKRANQLSAEVRGEPGSCEQAAHWLVCRIVRLCAK